MADPILVIKLEEDPAARAATAAAAQAGAAGTTAPQGGAPPHPSGMPHEVHESFQRAAEAATTSARSWDNSARSLERTGQVINNIGQQIGTAVGGFFGQSRAGGLVGGMFGSQFFGTPTVPGASRGDISSMASRMGYVIGPDGIPVLPGASMTDMMSLRHAMGIPTVHPASMGDIASAGAYRTPPQGGFMSADMFNATRSRDPLATEAGAGARFGIPVGRLVSGPPGGADGTGGGGATPGAGTGGPAGMGGGAVDAMGMGAMGGAIAGAVMAGLQNIEAGINKTLSAGLNDGMRMTSGLVQAGFGPIVGPLMGKLVDAMADSVDKLVSAPGVIAGRVGDIAGTAARGENADAIGKVYSGFVDLAEQVPLVGHSLGVLGDSAGGVVRAFRDMTMSFVDRGRELSGYSGGLATSYAMGDVRQMMADMKEAQTLDPALSRLNDAQNELSLMLRDLLLPIKKFVIETLAGALEALVQMIKDLLDWVDRFQMQASKDINAVLAAIEAGLAAVVSALPGTSKFHVNLGRVMIESWRLLKEEEVLDNGALDHWLNADRDFGKDGPWKAPDFAVPNLGIPILKER